MGCFEWVTTARRALFTAQKAVRPGAQLHSWLKTHSGQTVRILVEPTATP
jgi:hypothetical protein